MTRYAEGGSCRRKPLLAYFGETYTQENCGICDNCGAEPGSQTDITIPAQKFLSCVKRSGEKFGAAHIVDILLGADNEKIQKYSHQTLSTYGIGKELTKSQWMHISRQLVERGLLNQEPAYRVLSVTAKGLEMLRAREQVFGQINEAKRVGKVSAKLRASLPVEELEYDNLLFAQLRNKRKELADEEGVPPYVIFSDKTLVQMATYFPQDKDSLMNMSGMGKVKYERYGADFLKIIKAYARENKLEEKYKTPMRNKDDAGRRYVAVGEAYNAGESLESLMARYSVTADTILNHLARFMTAGNPLRTASDLLALSKLTPDQQQKVFSAFDELGPDMLRPVHEKLNASVNYDELKILRLCYLCEKR
jgi:ATP-dependent DNA helicase RecQ